MIKILSIRRFNQKIWRTSTSMEYIIMDFTSYLIVSNSVSNVYPYNDTEC